jgi:hypothetical protein
MAGSYRFQTQLKWFFQLASWCHIEYGIDGMTIIVSQDVRKRCDDQAL